MKRYIKDHNSAMTKTGVLNLAKQAYAKITPEHWEKAIAHCKKFEDMYAEMVWDTISISLPGIYKPMHNFSHHFRGGQSARAIKL